MLKLSWLVLRSFDFIVKNLKKLCNFCMIKGGLMSESIGRFSHCPKNVPKTILEYVLHPLHDNDKILIAYNLLQVKNYHSYKI